MSSISAGNLTHIGGTFQLSSLTSLGSLAFDALTHVGSLEFRALPVLQQLGFGGGLTEADRVLVTNTGLTSLDGISLQQAKAFIITENQYIIRVNVSAFKKATGPISFVGNQDGLTVDFPNLVQAGNITARNLGEFSVPSLKQLSGLLGLYDNDFLNFSAPSLTNTKDISINNNGQMSAIDLSQLKRVNGGITIAGNPELRNISLPVVKQIGGGVDFRGPLDDVQFESLNLVRGAFNVESFGGNMQCKNLGVPVNGHKVIRGKIHCKNGKDGNSGTSTTSSKGSSSTGTSSSSKGILSGLGRSNAHSINSDFSLVMVVSVVIIGSLLELALAM